MAYVTGEREECKRECVISRTLHLWNALTIYGAHQHTYTFTYVYYLVSDLIQVVENIISLDFFVPLSLVA